MHWHGVKVSQADWSTHSRSLAATARAPRLGAHLYWMANAYWEPLEFKLPPVPAECQGPWRRWIDTALEPPDDACQWSGGNPVTADQYRVEPRSLVILIVPEIKSVSEAAE